MHFSRYAQARGCREGIAMGLTLFGAGLNHSLDGAWEICLDPLAGKKVVISWDADESRTGGTRSLISEEEEDSIEYLSSHSGFF